MTINSILNRHDKLVAAYITSQRLHPNRDLSVKPSPAIVSCFPETTKVSYNYDDIVDLIFDECLKYARLGFISLQFNFYFTVNKTSSDIDNINEKSEINFFVAEKYSRLVPIQWNSQNSPNLAAELFSEFRRDNIYVSFPFDDKLGAIYEISWLEDDDRKAIHQMLSIKGGYEAWLNGVPILDIIA